MPSKKTKAEQAIIDTNPDRLRLIALEETICSWKHSGRLWDIEDPQVAEALKERDELWNKLEPQNPLNCSDVKETDWEEIDKEVAEEVANEDPDPDKQF